MNIFVLSTDPVKAAQQQCDKHVPKMVVESAQMLSTAHRLLSGDEYCDERGIYLKAYMNHPCTIWARETSQNYMWLYYHFFALCKEYETRYDRQHLSFVKLNDALSQLPLGITKAGLTTMPQAMPDEYKNDDPVQAYRDYVVNEKTYAQWNKIPTRQPDWWQCAS